ncbi:hypothetical protein FACS1894198_6320 [Clostridia bacterium]|nr:hypothetical protein FACS1894198_6320 [Clostridia bacterium]
MLRDDVIGRLTMFGYVVMPADEWMIDFTITKAEKKLKNDCSITEIPVELYEVVVDMIVGEFLFIKKLTNPDRIESLDLTPIAKQIAEGDTSVSFSVGSTPEETFDSVVNYLMCGSNEQLAAFRCIKW